MTLLLEGIAVENKLFDLRMIKACAICGKTFCLNEKLECCGMSFSLRENSLDDRSKQALEQIHYIIPLIAEVEEITIKIKKKKHRPRVDKKLRSFILKRDKNRCVECKCKTGLHVHHIVHRSKGGTDDPANLKTLCDLCHAEAHRGEPIYNIMIKALFKIS